MTGRPRSTRTSIGPYDVEADLGTSPLGEVYLIRLGGEPPATRVVMRELRPDLANPSELLPVLLQPLQLAIALDHPNVARTFGATSNEGQIYLATEYIDGPTWEVTRGRLWSAGQLHWSVHVRLLAEVLAGLSAAHEMNVVHGALCPANIFLTDDGRVKVSGFGNAEVERRAGIPERATPAHRHPYMAPECFATSAFNVRSDLFAVGVMLWEALSGEPLESGEAPRTLDVGAQVPELPTALLAICNRALATDTTLRPASAAEFRDALMSFLPGDSTEDDLRELARMARNLDALGVAAVQGEREAALEPEPPDRALGECGPLVDRSGGALATGVRMRLAPSTASASPKQPLQSRRRARWYFLPALMAPLLLILGWPRDAVPRSTASTAVSALPSRIESNTHPHRLPVALSIDVPLEALAQPSQQEDRIAEASDPQIETSTPPTSRRRAPDRPARTNPERPGPVGHALGTQPQSVNRDAVSYPEPRNHLDAGHSPARSRTIYEEEPF